MSRYIFDLDKWKHNTDQDAKDWVEHQFQEKYYGKEIYPNEDVPRTKKELDDFCFEGWDLRSLFEQAYMAGKESKLTKDREHE